MRTFAVLTTTMMALLFSACARDEDESAAHEAGRAARKVVTETKQAAKKAGSEIKEAAREAREGWKEQKREEGTKRDKK